MTVVVWHWLGADEHQSCSIIPLLGWKRENITKAHVSWQKQFSRMQKPKQRLIVEAKAKMLFSTFHHKDAVWSLLGSSPSIPIVVALEDRLHQRMSPYFLLSVSFYVWADIIWHRTTLWIILSDCVPSQDLAHSSVYSWAGQCWKSRALVLSSAIAKTVLC